MILSCCVQHDFHRGAPVATDDRNQTVLRPPARQRIRTHVATWHLDWRLVGAPEGSSLARATKQFALWRSRCSFPIIDSTRDSWEQGSFTASSGQTRCDAHCELQQHGCQRPTQLQTLDHPGCVARYKSDWDHVIHAFEIPETDKVRSKTGS